MHLSKNIQNYFLKSKLQNSLINFIKFFIYIILIFIEIGLFFILYILVRLFFVLPIYCGFLLLKISIYLPIFFFLNWLFLIFKLLFFIVKNNFFKFLKIFALFLIISFNKKLFLSNTEIGWSNKFWFNNYKRTDSLEFDFIEYNRSISKLLFRKNYKPINVLVSEKGLSEYFFEFKLKIFEAVPKFRYSKQEPTTEIFYKTAIPILYRLDLDYGDFEFLSKYSVSEVDIKDNFYLRQHKQSQYFLLNSIFNLFNQLNFKKIFDLETFYNFNSFLRNYHDDYLIIRNRIRQDDIELLNFGFLTKNQNEFSSYFFYSGNSFWDRFSFDSFLSENGSEMDDLNNTLYVPEVVESYDYPNQFFNMHDTTLLNYLFGGSNSFYQKDVLISIGHTRNLGYPHYDFDLAERFFFWNFKLVPLSYGNDKFDTNIEDFNNNLLYSRYGVLGPLLLHDWNLFYPHFFDYLVDFDPIAKGNFKIDYFLNVQDYRYYDIFFEFILKNFSSKKVKNILTNDLVTDIKVKNFPPLLNIPHLNDSRLIPYENEVYGESDYFLTKYAQNIPKYPFGDLYNQQYLAQKTKLPLWILKLGKYNHELVWSSRVLSPFSLSPTKKRMSTSDFWILRKSFLKGFINVKEVYFYIKTYRIFSIIRDLETKIIFFIFNILPSEIFLVELKYFFLNFLLKFSFLDQILINLTNFFNFDFLEFKWFFIRLLILISDIYLWFIFAYVKIFFSIIINILFDDFLGLILYYIKIFEIYYIDAFLPLQSSIANRGDFLFTEFFFKYDFLDDLFEILNIQSEVIPRKGRKTNFINNWVRPSERNRKSLYGFYYPTQFRFFYYDLYQRPPFRRNTSFTWRRGNTILFGYGNKSFLRDFYSKKTIKLKRLMRYETGISNEFRMHHIRMRPFEGYWSTYNFLNFNYHYGIRNQYYNLSFNNLLLFEKFQSYNIVSDDFIFKNKKNYYFFSNFFNTSLKPKSLLSIFKHFYFFNAFRGFEFFLPQEQSLYKYDFHYIPFMGLKKTKLLKFSLPFLDLLSLPNQYLLKKPKQPFWFFRVFKFWFGVTLYKPKVPKLNYYPIMYKHSPVYQYKQYLMLLNWHALILHGFINTTLFFYPMDFQYKRINPRHPHYLNFSFFNFYHYNSFLKFNTKLFHSLIYFFFNVNTLQHFVAKQHLDIYIKLQNLFVWSFGNHIKFWNYTSPYMERNFVDFFWIPITSLYTSRFLDDGMRLENGLSLLSYNSVFNRLFTRVKGTKTFIKKESIMFIPGTGVEPMEQFFWTHNQHDFDFFYLTQHTREWSIHDLSTLEDNRFLNIYTQPHKNRPYLLDFDLSERSSSSIEIEPGIDVFENQFSEIDTYFIWDNHRRLSKAYLSNRLRFPFDTDMTRILHFQYKITSGRKLTVFIIAVWYNFIIQVILLLKYVLINYFFEFVLLYIVLVFFFINLSCFRLLCNFFFLQQRNLNIWFSERMLLYEEKNIQFTESKFFERFFKITEKDFYIKLNFFFPHMFKVFKISSNYKDLRNFLFFNFILSFFKNYKYVFISCINTIINEKLFFNVKFSKFFLFLKFYIKKLFIYISFFQKYKFIFLKLYLYNILNKKFFFFFLRIKNYYFYRLLMFTKKMFCFFFFFISFSIFLFFFKEYMLLKNIYLSEFSSIFLMFIFLLFIIWLLSTISKTFIINFLNSQYPIDQYLQDYSTDFVGESFVYEDSLYFYLYAFQEDELFDADSFPFYYAWFTQFVGTNFLVLFFASKAAQMNLENQRDSNYLSGFGWDAENSSRIYGTPAYLKNGLKNFFVHVFTTFLRQKDMYRFNNDISIFYEYEESIKTVTNLITKINYNNSKNYKKFDLPWEIVDGFIYMQYLSNNFWYYHSELFVDTDRVLFFNNAETSTDYNEMMLLETRGDVPNEPITSFDLFEGDEGIELIEFNNEDFEIDDVPIELMDFSEEANLNFMFRYYENFSARKNSFDNLMNYNFYFNNDLAENILVKESGWIKEIMFDRFLLNIVSKDFLFPADNELLSFIGIYFEEINLRYNIDKTFLQAMNIEFRDLMTKYMLQIKPLSIYRNNIYNSQTILHLIRRLNYRRIPFKKIYVEYLKRFPKNRMIFGPSNEKLVSFRWDTGVDLAISLYHPHDVLFKLTKNIGLFNFVPYHYFFNDLNFRIIPILGYEMFNNKFKKRFFSNVPYFVKTLNLSNYPDLTLTEAERLWVFLGCTRQQWDSLDFYSKDLSIYPFDDWDFPFIFISLLFAIHYHKSNKLRGNIGIRGGAPIGFNIHSRFQIIKRTEKRQKWRKKRLLRPTDESPLYYSINFFETVSSFFENLIFSNNSFIFFSKNLIINDFLIIFLDFQVFFLSYFCFIFSDYQATDLFFIKIIMFFELIFSLFFYFTLKFYFLFFIIFFLIFSFSFFFFNILNIKIFVWVKFSFFFFSTFLTLLFLSFFKNILFFNCLVHFIYFFVYYLFSQILNLFYFLLFYFI